MLENVFIGCYYLMRFGTLRSGLWLGSVRCEECCYWEVVLDAFVFIGLDG